MINMKTTQTIKFIVASMVGLSAMAVHAADPAKEQKATAGKSGEVSRIEVKYLEPDNFTDIGDNPMASEKSREADLNDLRRHIVTRAAHYIPEGQRLEVTFTDIDRAGAFESWRPPPASDTRIVKTIYPPTMKFSYRLTDVNGNVVKQGERTLSDPNFQINIGLVDRSDPIYHEKNLIDRWLSDEFRPSKA